MSNNRLDAIKGRQPHPRKQQSIPVPSDNCREYSVHWSLISIQMKIITSTFATRKRFHSDSKFIYFLENFVFHIDGKVKTYSERRITAAFSYYYSLCMRSALPRNQKHRCGLKPNYTSIDIVWFARHNENSSHTNAGAVAKLWFCNRHVLSSAKNMDRRILTEHKPRPKRDR